MIASHLGMSVLFGASTGWNVLMHHILSRIATPHILPSSFSNTNSIITCVDTKNPHIQHSGMTVRNGCNMPVVYWTSVELGRVNSIQ